MILSHGCPRADASFLCFATPRRNSHWNAIRSLSEWMASENVPGITGIDTR